MTAQYADTGEYTKPIHDKPHNICCDDTCTDCYKGLGTVTGGTNGVIKIENGGTFNLFEGTITGNSGSSGIIENSGTLNIYGGTITNNAGGGVIGTGTVNFKEGNPVIESNTKDGAICNVKGAETISVTVLREDASIGF